MSKNFPDVSKLLPSQAKAELKAYFLERLKEAELNYLGDPKYSATAANTAAGQAGHSLGDYYYNLAGVAFKEARETFDSLYPKQFWQLKDGSFQVYRAAAKGVTK